MPTAPLAPPAAPISATADPHTLSTAQQTALLLLAVEGPWYVGETTNPHARTIAATVAAELTGAGLARTSGSIDGRRPVRATPWGNTTLILSLVHAETAPRTNDPRTGSALLPDHLGRLAEAACALSGWGPGDAELAGLVTTVLGSRPDQWVTYILGRPLLDGDAGTLGFTASVLLVLADRADHPDGQAQA